MKALITGASGFVGGHLYKYLTKHTDWELIVHRRGGDFKRIGAVDYVINLASISSVEQSISSPEYIVNNNVDLMLKLMQYAREYPPKVFLHLSTVEIYNVTNPYAASKAAQEDIANAYWKTYGVPVVIARASNIVGPGQQPDKFLPKIIDQIKSGKTVSIYTSNGKQGSRIYNPVENVCSAIKYLLEVYPDLHNYSEDFPVEFDLAGGQLMTNLKMAVLVSQMLNKQLKYKMVEPKAVRPTYARRLTTSGAKLEDYGWKAPQTLEEGLQWIASK